MNIKRVIDKNGKLIWYVVLIIIFILLAVKSLNSYYEKEEKIKKAQVTSDETSVKTQNTTTTNKNTNYSTKSNSSYKTIDSFVNYCNNRELENAYKMLTDECKNAMFQTMEEFETLYVNKIYNVTRDFELLKWSTEGNKTTYLISLYEDILATGNTENYVQDYYTLVKNDDGFYKLNINNYIYGEERDLESTVKNITIKIGTINIYEEYEEATITITNNTSKTIGLIEDTYIENIHLQNEKGIKYSALNGEFDDEETVIKPKDSQTYIIEFNKIYSSSNKAKYLVIDDVILDYEDYLNSNDKENYSNMTSIKVEYQE